MSAAERRISLGHLTIIDTPTPELIRIAAETGYDYASPRFMSGGLPGTDITLSRNPELLRQTRAAVAETGLGIHDIELARIADGIDPLSYEPDLAIGAELGVGSVLSSIWTTDHRFAVDSFGRLCALAAQYGQTVNLEFLPIGGVDTMAGALAVLAETAAPNGRLLVDLHHLHRSRESLAELAATPPELIGFAQVCDAPGEIPTDRDEMIRIIRAGRDYLGEGGCDPGAMLRALPDVVYSVEIPNDDHLRRYGARGHARRCLETTRAFLARVFDGAPLAGAGADRRGA